MLTKAELETIFDQEFKKLVNYAFYKTGDESLSKDIAQEAMIALWKNKNRLTAQDANKFLFRVVANLSVDHIRKKKVRSDFANLQKQPNVSYSADFELMEKEFREKLERAIARLTEKQRVVFLMSRIDDLKYYEIAQRLEISVKSVEKRMHNTLRQLRLTINEKI